MPEQKISKENLPSKLYERDLNHIKRKVATDGKTDTRFKDKSSTIRYYVHIGIVNEKRVETAHTLDDKIIKASQEEVVSKSLSPLKKSIDDLITVMKNFETNQTEFFTESARQNEYLTRRIEGLNEMINSTLGDLIRQLLHNGRVSEETLRNVIILRSIQFVFLLGYKTGRIDPQERAPWDKLVKFAHQKAAALSLEELHALAEGKVDSATIEQLASEMFDTLRDFHRELSAG